MTVKYISGSATGPVTFGSYSMITVTGTGRVTATSTGVEASGTLISDGYISATGIGVFVYAGQSATNQSNGKMLGGDGASGVGVSLASGATFSNDGLVKATYAVALADGGTVSNGVAGTIEGIVTGVLAGATGSTTITNAGTISGGSDTGVAVALNEAAGNLLVVDPGAVFTGTVKGGGAGSTLEFASGASQGTFSGLGSHYAGFGQVSIGAGAFWTASGANTLAAGQTITDSSWLFSTGQFTNAGTIIAADVGIDEKSGTFVNDGLLTAGLEDAIGVFSGGVLTNALGGTIAGRTNIGAFVGAGGAMSNAGLITGVGNGGAGYIIGGGAITNLAGGTISGTSVGLFEDGGTLINAGTIAGAQTADFAVTVFVSSNSLVVVDPGADFVGTVAGGGTGSTLEFASGASVGTFAGLGSQYADFAQVSVASLAHWTASGVNTLAAGQTLVEAGYLAATGPFTNAGVILASNAFVQRNGTFTNEGSVSRTSGGYAVYATDGSVITNAASGRITGDAGEGVLVDGSGTLVNGGFISSSGKYGGVFSYEGGVVTNLAGGTILGAATGLLGDHSTLINAGTIAAGSATGDAIRFLSAGNARVVVDPGAVFVGTVDGFNTIGATAVSLLEFASGASSGTFAGLGSHYVNFAHIQVDTGANWTASGVNTIASGATLLDDGALTFTAAPVGDGNITLAGFGVTLAVDGGAPIGPSIGGLAGNTVELAGTVEHYATLSGHELTLDGGATLSLAGSYAAGQVSVTNDGTNTFVTACFANGTMIATASGEVAVEALRVGARVATASGRLAAVRWIGYRRVDLRRHARPDEVMPVRVRAGALGDGVPARDLVLSPDHAVFVEGVLVPVRYLVNGRSIVAERRERVTYWHVELDRHDLVLAEGLACESYLDTGNRDAFEGEAAVALHPDFGREHALGVWASEACAPILFDPADPELRALHTGLLARAERVARAA